MSTNLAQRLMGRAKFEYFRVARPTTISLAGKLLVPNFETYPARVLRGLASGWYERDEIAEVQRLAREGRIRRGMKVMDVGTAIGLVAMVIADIVGDENLEGYEADPQTAADCRRNLEANGHEFVVNNAAMTAVDDATVTFNVHEDFWASSLVAKSQGGRTVTVPARNFVRELERVKPEMIMMDVEGAEVDLLTSVRDFASVKTLVVELHPQIVGEPALERLLRHLGEAGFIRDKAGSVAVAVFVR